MRQLISFLGRAAREYRTTRYEFQGGAWPATQYFGLALARHLQPDRLILLGTPGSMWDVLLQDHVDADLNEAHLELAEAAVAGRVTQPQLELLRPMIERAVGRPTRLRLIGEARTAAEQARIVADLAALLDAGDEVALDLTHGYRHTSMLALVAARYLQRVRGVKVAGLYYGALDMTREGRTPVLELDGLAGLLDWVERLASYDASGDLGTLAEPLRAAGLDPDSLRHWTQAAFDERNQNTAAAAKELAGLPARLERLQNPAFALFRGQLRGRLEWAAARTRAEQEWALGRRHLERGDWLRAAILLTEGLISASSEGESREAREAAKAELMGETSFSELMAIRNALAHGNPDRDSKRRERIANIVTNRGSLPDRLRRLADELETASLWKGPTAAGPH